MIAFCRLPLHMDLPPLLAELEHLLALDWVNHVNHRDYEGGWDVLPLRCQRQHVQANPILQGFALAGTNEWEDLPALQASPALRALLAQLQCPLLSVRLMRLRPGSVIKPHRDQGLAFEAGEARLHLPLTSDPSVRFTVAGAMVPLGVGELWYINVDLEHAVYHAGSSDRIHLVIDCAVNDWLATHIHTAANVPAAAVIA